MRAYNDTILNSNTGRPLIGAQMRVLTQPGFAQPPSGLASIYADANMTPAANPLTVEDGSSPSPGFAQFYAADGFYTVEYIYGGQTIRTIRDLDISSNLTHAEIEDDTGASLIGTPSGNVQSDLNARPDRPNLGIADFAGTPDAPNIATIIAAAVAEGQATRREVRIPGGLYTATETIDLTGVNLRVVGSGMVVIQSSASPIVRVDPGDDTVRYDHLIENLVLIGDGSSGQIGFYQRNTLHSVRRSIWVRNCAGKGFDIEGDVLSRYEDCRVTNKGVDDPHKPLIGWHLRGSAYLGGALAACTYINCIAEEAVEHGWLLEDVNDCAWLGGTSEAIEGIGIELGSTCSGNTFIQMFCEENGVGDVRDAGKGQRYINCTMASAAGGAKSLLVKDTAVGATVEGGDSFHLIEIESGALNTTLRNFECHTLTDNGTGTVIQDFLRLNDSAARYPGQTLGNVNSQDPLVLDWYQQGSVEASIGGSSTDGTPTQAGTTTFTRIGDRVFFETTIQITSFNSDPPTGDLQLRTGLPWNAASDYGAAISYMQGFSMPANREQFGLEGITGTALLRIRATDQDGGAAASLLTGDNLTGFTPLQITFSGCFRVGST